MPAPNFLQVIARVLTRIPASLALFAVIASLWGLTMARGSGRDWVGEEREIRRPLPHLSPEFARPRWPDDRVVTVLREGHTSRERWGDVKDRAGFASSPRHD